MRITHAPFGFQGSISHPGDGIAIATASVNTALGTSAAGISTLIVNKTGIIPGTGGYYSFLTTMNGSLTGEQLIANYTNNKSYLSFFSKIEIWFGFKIFPCYVRSCNGRKKPFFVT